MSHQWDVIKTIMNDHKCKYSDKFPEETQSLVCITYECDFAPKGRCCVVCKDFGSCNSHCGLADKVKELRKEVIQVRKETTKTKEKTKEKDAEEQKQEKELKELKEKSNRLDTIRKKIGVLKTNIMCGILDLGILLLEVQRNKLYEIADYETFDAFLSGDVDVSRTTAYRAMQLVEVFIEVMGYTRPALEKMDETKLLAIVPVIDKLQKEGKSEEIEAWFEKAKSMSKQDLITDVTEYLGKPNRQSGSTDKLLDKDFTGTFKLVRMDGSEGYENFKLGSATVKVFKLNDDFYIEV